MLAFIFASKYLHIMEIRRDVFQAIADPTRREIIRLIATQPVKINTIAERFDVTRQAISLHLKILSECGLLHIRQSGRERLCEAKLEKLIEVHDWVEQYSKLWKGRLKALKNFVEQEELQSKIIKKNKRNKINQIKKSKK
ncbi:MAG: helix-turn-helix transcriptional regulator [Bacteroidetes bacterium]|nr:helix-turn-helix transcriptional regulator [Bacteroidota bacterium]